LSELPRYRALRSYLVDRFGEPVHRVTIRGGFTCPNRDGTKGRGGCAFCRVDASAGPAEKTSVGVEAQLRDGMERVGRRFGVKRFFAYFNDYSATYGPVDRLERLYRQAVAPKEVVGLAIGTRPDCLPADVVDLLAELAEETELWVELGAQTASQKTLDLMGRRHTVEELVSAVSELQEKKIAVCLHVITGLPGEGEKELRRTADLVRSLGVSGVKIHNLHILRGSRWESDHRSGTLEVPTLEEHARAAVCFLERIPPRVVVHRLIGDAPRRFLVAPEWCTDKQRALARIRRKLQERDTWQGKAIGAGRCDVIASLRV
jgi:radical SAM protein (TIGR01212 family)